LPDNKYNKSKVLTKAPREERKQEEPMKMTKSGSLGQALVKDESPKKSVAQVAESDSDDDSDIAALF
jgi:hypothetical protein